MGRRVREGVLHDQRLRPGVLGDEPTSLPGALGVRQVGFGGTERKAKRPYWGGPTRDFNPRSRAGGALGEWGGRCASS